MIPEPFQDFLIVLLALLIGAGSIAVLWGLWAVRVRQIEATRLEAMKRILQEALCDCAARAPDDVQLTTTPGTHEWSCPYRKAMQPYLASAEEGIEQ